VSAALTLLIFGATIVLVVLRPRGMSESFWTCGGAASMVALRIVTLDDMVDVLRAAYGPLVFLLALLVLSALIECSGFFDWAALGAARLARGEPRILFRNVFLLGAAVTTFLSLDTTAVILTPLVLAFVARLELPARPYVLACAFVANAASLTLPISNLTNLLFADTFHFSFAAFAGHMLLPQVAALAVTYAALAHLVRRELGARFEVRRLPAPSSVVAHVGYFRACVGALAVACGSYFVAPLAGVPPYVPALGVTAVLAGCAFAMQRVSPGGLAGRVGWSVFPFVIGLFVVVRGLEHLGVARWAVRAMAASPSRPWLALPVAAGTAAVLSNLLNNLPAALVVRSALTEVHAPPLEAYAALLGTNIGPNVFPFASLATLLVLGRARERKVPIAARDFVRIGAIVTPLALLGATGVLGGIAPSLKPGARGSLESPPQCACASANPCVTADPGAG
jgi:arsenical pump membrane protein